MTRRLTAEQLRARIDRLPFPLDRAARALIGPGLDAPEYENPRAALAALAKNLHLFPPVAMVVFMIVGAWLAPRWPARAACDPRTVKSARLAALALYEVLVAPALTGAFWWATRSRLRDPRVRHAAGVAMVLIALVSLFTAWAASSEFLFQDARLRAYGAAALRCAFVDGRSPTP